MKTMLKSELLIEDMENILWFVFYKDKLLVRLKDNKVYIPSLKDLDILDMNGVNEEYIGMLDDNPCYFIELKEEETIKEDMLFAGLRELMDFIDHETFFLAGKALQLIIFNRNNKYCGKCGQVTVKRSNKNSRVCSDCGLVIYPKISPAVMIAITKGDKILLASNSKFRSNYYSVLAGFVDPGERLEDAIKREVMEEVGIEIKNVKYFGSQPWPFPDALMIAFIAEYDKGEVKVDDKELVEAKWFSIDNMPDIPGPISLSRKLIDWFIESRETVKN